MPDNEKIKQYSLNFNPGHFFSDSRVERMSSLSIAYYALLIFKIWGYDDTQHRIRDDDDEIAKLLKIRKSLWLKIKAEIQWPGDPILKAKDGYLYSKRLKQEKDKRDAYSKIQSQNAKKRYQ